MSASLFTLAATVGLENVVESVIATSAATTTETVITRSSISSSAMRSDSFVSRAATLSFSASATSSTSSINSGGSSISTAVKAGIGAGVAILAMLLGIILFLLHKIKKQRKPQANWDKEELPSSNQQQHQEPEEVAYARNVENNPVELPGQVVPQEMNAQRGNFELDTSERAQSIRVAK